MMPARAAPLAARPVAPPSLHMVAGVAALVAVSFAMVRRYDDGIAAVLVVWLAAAPLCLGPLVPAWRAELPGAVCFFAVAGSVWFIDERLGARVSVACLFLAFGFLHLMRRHGETGRLLRSPILVALAAFVAMQVVSAYIAGPPELHRVVVDRALMFLFVLCAAVLARRPGGRWLLPALLILCTLASLPLMLRELSDPFPGNAGRAGGLYGGPNYAGIMLSFGFAAAGVLHVEGLLSGAAFGALAVLFFVGLFSTGSRGALINALVALGVTFGGRLWARRGPGALVVAGAAILAVALLLPSLSGVLVRATDRLEASGFANAERLQETVLALSGSDDAIDDVMKNDSHRITLVDEAVARISRRPWFGYGTGGFMQDARRSHMQFLEILGENGIVGLLFYLVLLAVVARALMRLPPQPRLCAAILLSPWLVTHFHNHSLVEDRSLNLVLAYVAALADRYAPSATART